MAHRPLQQDLCEKMWGSAFVYETNDAWLWQCGVITHDPWGCNPKPLVTRTHSSAKQTCGVCGRDVGSMIQKSNSFPLVRKVPKALKTRVHSNLLGKFYFRQIVFIKSSSLETIWNSKSDVIVSPCFTP